MAPKGLSDDQVAGELRKMVEFIKKEADEKAKEIELKANEEYEIEKANIVRSESAAIDTQYEKKYKQASLSQQIAKSTVINKTRLKVLSAREEVVDSLVDEAEKELKTIPKRKDYADILKGLILEGLYALMESSVTVKVQESDKKTVEKILSAVEDEYEKETKSKVSVKIDPEALPSDIAGGVIVVNSTGKIEVNNTLEERLKIVARDALPGLRMDIFGPSASRKFFD